MRMRTPGSPTRVVPETADESAHHERRRHLQSGDSGAGPSRLQVRARPNRRARRGAVGDERRDHLDATTSYRKTPLGEFEAFRVNGTPSDCVALGTHLWERVDVVLSGINLGPNVGNGIWHSGTVSAARQSVLLGCRGIAFSTPVTDEEPRFETLEPFVERALELLLADTSLRLVNVNLPQRPSRRRLDPRVGPPVRRLGRAGQGSLGRGHFWFTVKPLEPADEGTDRWALEHDLVSMTPLRLDLTDEDCLKKTKEQAAAEARPKAISRSGRSDRGRRPDAGSRGRRPARRPGAPRRRRHRSRP